MTADDLTTLITAAGGGLTAIAVLVWLVRRIARRIEEGSVELRLVSRSAADYEKDNADLQEENDRLKIRVRELETRVETMESAHDAETVRLELEKESWQEKYIAELEARPNVPPSGVRRSRSQGGGEK